MKFLIFGTLPPPVGGVTFSNLNLINSLKSIGMNYEIFSIKTLFRFKRFDIGHIHYYKSWKVFIAIIFSKLLCKKTIYTSHGAEFYPKKNLDERVVLYLIDGMITLNKEVYNRCFSLKKENVVKLPTLYREGVLPQKDKTESILSKRRFHKYILMYAFNKRYKDGKEVYGCKFVLNLLDSLPSDSILVFVNPTGEYRDDIPKSDKIIYIDRVVDFNSLLTEVDLYIRPTNFDGNSVATLEALTLGTPVLASDVVERNSHITIYKADHIEDFLNRLKIMLYSKKRDNRFTLESITRYTDFCLKILKDRSKK